ncbi:MAG: protein-disulfide reductase DsbD N-terminal domain-containing protein [Methylomonas sp.]|nr:protein-disulfide reductase DsbD N-terminal domain-containing protein [Methylomonas sp.]
MSIARVLLLNVLMVYSLCSSAFWFDSEEPLPADEAFQLVAELKDAETVRLSWDIANGYYLYREKFQFVSKTPGTEVKTPDFPSGQIKQDQALGAVEIYRDRLELKLPLRYLQEKPAHITLELGYRGCADSGFCYMPIKKQITLDVSDR